MAQYSSCYSPFHVYAFQPPPPLLPPRRLNKSLMLMNLWRGGALCNLPPDPSLPSLGKIFSLVQGGRCQGVMLIRLVSEVGGGRREGQRGVKRERELVVALFRCVLLRERLFFFFSFFVCLLNLTFLFSWHILSTSISFISFLFYYLSSYFFFFLS